jgi:hypothetical protein
LFAVCFNCILVAAETFSVDNASHCQLLVLYELERMAYFSHTFYYAGFVFFGIAHGKVRE